MTRCLTSPGKVARKRLPSSEVGCDFPFPEPQNAISFSEGIGGWEEPLQPFQQVQEWGCVPVPHCMLWDALLTHLLVVSASAWDEFSQLIHALMECL